MDSNKLNRVQIILWAVILCLCISENSFNFVDGAFVSSSSQSNSDPGSTTNSKSIDETKTKSKGKSLMPGFNNLRSTYNPAAFEALPRQTKFPISLLKGENPSIIYTKENNNGEKMAYAEITNAVETPLESTIQSLKAYEDIETHFEKFINSKLDLNNNMDVIIQAFRFVKLDSHLNALVTQFAKLQKSHDNMQKQTVKQETKFDMILDQIKTMVDSVTGNSAKLQERERRMDTEIMKMNQRLDQAVEKIIKSSTTSNIMLELSKESTQQMDKIEGITNEVLKEMKAVKTELGDVGQVSIQTIYNTHKLEENLMAGLAEMGNRTTYALRQFQIIDRTVLLENGSEGNFIQADGRSSSSPGGNPFSSHSLKKVPGRVYTENQDGRESESTTKAAGSLMPCKRLINGKPRDCGEIQLLGHTQSGVYKIYPLTKSNNPTDAEGKEVFCDLETEGGGWTVIQRRGDHRTPRENFYRTWADYEKGFGSLYSQHWIGLTKIAELTKSGDQELRVELTDWDNNFREANYVYFRVSNSTDKFRIHLADYSGTAGDSLTYHNGMPFSTKDQDNDMDKSTNCAQRYQAAWWYKGCHQSNLNGAYLGNKGKHDSYAMGINWYSWHGYYYTLQKTEMKIRNRNFLQIN